MRAPANGNVCFAAGQEPGRFEARATLRRYPGVICSAGLAQIQASLVLTSFYGNARGEFSGDILRPLRVQRFFEKSEKKPCQPVLTSVFLTPKPNQTNGETNDKTRA